MNEEYELVKDYHRKLGQASSEFPASMTPENRAALTTAILGQVAEFNEAWTLSDQVGSILWMIYLNLGALVHMGVEPDGLFELVHEVALYRLWNSKIEQFSPDGEIEYALRDELVRRITIYVEEHENDERIKLPFEWVEDG